MALFDTKAVLLVGGLGTRLRAVLPSLPKPLARIGDQPFLAHLVRQLESQNIRNIVMCISYLADQIEHEFGNGSDYGVRIEYSRESCPLGTGGAIKHAQVVLEGVPDFIVLNGDSFLEADFAELLRTHREQRALATIALVSVEDAGRYGTVRIDDRGWMTAFCEKTGDNSPSLINAGAYVFSRAIFEHIPIGQVSLEKDIFPKILDRGIYTAKQEGLFIDLGTPADYAQAQQLSERIASHNRASSKGRRPATHT